MFLAQECAEASRRSRDSLSNRKRCRRRYCGPWERSPSRGHHGLVADAGLVIADPVAHFEDQELLAAALVELEAGDQDVGRLLVVVEHEMAAGGADLDGYLTPSPRRAACI